jgi:uncharacterized protein
MKRRGDERGEWPAERSGAGRGAGEEGSATMNQTGVLLHAVTDAHFGSLAAGYGDTGAVAALADGQLSRRKLLLRALAYEAAEHVPEASRGPGFETGCALLAEIEHEAPEVLTGPGGVLRHPYLGVWAMRCLRALTRLRADEKAPERVAAELDYVAAAAAVAAARAGRAAEVEVTALDGTVVLPTLGRALVSVADGRVLVRAAGGEVAVRRDGRDPVLRWDATTVLRVSGPVRLEDTDPYRDAYGRPVAGRLSAGEADQWRRTFEAAWELIDREHPAHLPGLAAGLTALTPLAQPASGAGASATSRHAFGAVSAALPSTAARLALLLVHELQHLKLGALLDLVPLLDGSDTRLYYAPWRPDPRPLPALLQGAYAHLAVTDFWRVHRHSHLHRDGADAEAATAEFARRRAQTAEVVDVLLASPTLTDAGRRFAQGMAATLAPWLAEPVPRAAVDAAERAAAQHRAAFHADH